MTGEIIIALSFNMQLLGVYLTWRETYRIGCDVVDQAKLNRYVLNLSLLFETIVALLG